MKIGDLVTCTIEQFQDRIGIIVHNMLDEDMKESQKTFAPWQQKYFVYWGFDIPVVWFSVDELRLINGIR
jgi:hypothetical protein